jgi:hypothetical protein
MMIFLQPLLLLLLMLLLLLLMLLMLLLLLLLLLQQLLLLPVAAAAAAASLAGLARLTGPPPVAACASRRSIMNCRTSPGLACAVLISTGRVTGSTHVLRYVFGVMASRAGVLCTASLSQHSRSAREPFARQREATRKPATSRGRCCTSSETGVDMTGSINWVRYWRRALPSRLERGWSSVWCGLPPASQGCSAAVHPVSCTEDARSIVPRFLRGLDSLGEGWSGAAGCTPSGAGMASGTRQAARGTQSIFELGGL